MCSKHQATQEAAQQPKAYYDGQHDEQQKPGAKRPAFDLMLRCAEVVIDALLVFGVKAAGHGHLE
ncbi:hypothetical protein A3710_04255 [Stutzerimonas frequens]|nr:hypothetical protein A3710_04255 [Stutzerimonas frequens]